MLIARVTLLIDVFLILIISIIIIRKFKKDKRLLNVPNLLTILSGIFIVILVFIFPYAFPGNKQTSKVEIVEWDSRKSYNKPIMRVMSCRDEALTSNILATEPVYFLILELDIDFTFSNNGDIPNSIVDTRIVTIDPYGESTTGLDSWYLFISSHDDPEKQINDPLELPQHSAREWNFKAFQWIETKPGIGVSPILTEYINSLTPVTWRFKTQDNSTLEYQHEFLTDYQEAVIDEQFDFTDSCEDIVPVWVFPAIRLQIST